jgi:hypothetical protein
MSCVFQPLICRDLHFVPSCAIESHLVFVLIVAYLSFLFWRSRMIGSKLDDVKMIEADEQLMQLLKDIHKNVGLVDKSQLYWS